MYIHLPSLFISSNLPLLFSMIMDIMMANIVIFSRRPNILQPAGEPVKQNCERAGCGEFLFHYCFSESRTTHKHQIRIQTTKALPSRLGRVSFSPVFFFGGRASGGSVKEKAWARPDLNRSQWLFCSFNGCPKATRIPSYPTGPLFNLSWP